MMPDRFDNFIHDENVRNFKKQIEAATDPSRLEILRALLRTEEAKKLPIKRLA